MPTPPTRRSLSRARTRRSSARQFWRCSRPPGSPGRRRRRRIPLPPISDQERKTKAIAASASWRKRNHERYIIGLSKWKKENAHKVKASMAAWREANKEKIKIKDSEYRKNNPDKVRATLHNKRARKRRNGGKLSPDILSRLFFLQKGKCAICKKKIKMFGSHVDHIVPVARGGKNTDSNVQLTCSKCNLKKGSKDPIEFMQSLGFLL